jgi:hypothetical protein
MGDHSERDGWLVVTDGVVTVKKGRDWEIVLVLI